MPNRKFVYICIICERKLKDELENELDNAGAALISLVYGRGYYESRNLFDYLGFGSKKGKVIMSSLIERGHALNLIEKLNEQYLFKNPGSGIAFTVPVESIVY